MIWIRYKHSKLASMISAFGAALIVMGFYLLGSAIGFVSASEGTGSVAGDVAGGIGCLVGGIVLMIIARKVAENKEIKYQKKMEAKAAAKAAKAAGKAPKKKSSTGKKVGIVLVALELFVIAFSIYQGNPIWVKTRYMTASAAAGMYVGYFLPAIIGIILIIRGSRKEEAVSETISTSRESTPTSGETTSASAGSTSSADRTVTSSATGTWTTEDTDRTVGTSSFTSARKVRICPKCGAEAEDDDSFCIYCGTRIE